MTIDLEPKILRWIQEEITNIISGNSPRAVSIQLLMMRLALEGREDDESLTMSTEISLKAFERANLFRVLRQLERKGILVFVNEKGVNLEAPSQDGTSIGIEDEKLKFLNLTRKGEMELTRLLKLQN